MIERRAHTPHTAPVTRSRPTSGFTILELALVLSISGMVLAVAIPTFVQTLEASKAAEASKNLETLFRNSAAYYAMARTTTGPKPAYCLPAAAGPAPLVASASPIAVDFSADDTPGSATWRALEFTPSEPIRFRYTFLPHGAACLVDEPAQPPRLTLRAEGDLDADSVFSRFERRAKLRANGLLEPEPMLHISDRIE